MTPRRSAGRAGAHGPEVQALARVYGPMLDALQAALDEQLAPVTWSPRADATEVVLHDGSGTLRVAAINAIGVRTAELSPPALSSATNRVLERWGFPRQPTMTGSSWGDLVCTAVDDRGARFTLQVKHVVDAWVDHPL